ncbi:MAG TPA: hypothetical protein VLG47_03190 [Candidatus Saccharimonadales bacterium]|nr:hypothetical protein [Candidatus Saccharimonadales bacterium]
MSKSGESVSADDLTLKKIHQSGHASLRLPGTHFSVQIGDSTNRIARVSARNVRGRGLANDDPRTELSARAGDPEYTAGMIIRPPLNHEDGEPVETILRNMAATAINAAAQIMPLISDIR